MNKTLTVALSMCAGVAMVGAGVFAASTDIDTTIGSISDKVRQGVVGQFGKDTARVTSTTIQAAIQANDYSKLSTEEQANITQEQFTQMVTKQQSMQATQTAIESAVKANDLTAYKAALTAQKTAMEANKPASESGQSRPELTDDEIKSRFETMVEYYNTNGELPAIGAGGKRGEMGQTRTTSATTK